MNFDFALVNFAGILFNFTGIILILVCADIIDGGGASANVF